jgi:UTP--glucose-1-phosphate uridylyltransferase
MIRVTKAVFPVAGMGTRFLPATKASPKEMLPIVDKPLIQYAVEEAVAAGITDMIFIIGRTKRAIADHFDKAYELEKELEAKGKHRALELLRGMLPDNVSCIFIRQAEALGLGHAVLCAEPAVNNEPFAVLLADDLIDANPGATKQMVDNFGYYQCSLLGVQNVAPEETAQYGIVASQPLAERLHRVSGIVEKPKPEDAPSTLGVVGRYVLTPRIFHHLKRIQRGAGGELQLTDAIAALLGEQQVLAYEFEGVRYDCGSKLGYLKATVEYALKHPELAEEFRTYARKRFCHEDPASQPGL